jgi:hypothetical protein
MSLFFSYLPSIIYASLHIFGVPASYIWMFCGVRWLAAAFPSRELAPGGSSVATIW